MSISGPRVGGASWQDGLAVGVFPGILFSAHLLFGANQSTAALVLTVVIALALPAMMIWSPARRSMSALGPLLVPGLLFVGIVGVALWTLTPLTPGGPNPVWFWPGIPANAVPAATINRSATLIEIAKLFGLACAFLIGFSQAGSRKKGDLSISAILVVGGVYASISLLLFLSGLQPLSVTRLAGGFLTANSAATVMGILTLLTLASLQRGWRRHDGISWPLMLSRLGPLIALFILVTGCLVLTASRTGVSVTAISCLVFLAFERMRGKVSASSGWPIAILLGIAVTGLVLLAANHQLWLRMDQLRGDADARALTFSTHWAAFQQFPLFGWGLGTFTEINNIVMTPDNYFPLWQIRAAHNVYIQWLEEAGIVGAVPMFSLIAVILIDGLWRARMRKQGRTILLGLVCASLVVLLHGFTDFALQEPSVAAFWAFLLGILHGFGRIADPKPH